VQTLSYETIIHIDQIYRPPTAASEDWPERHCFKWQLGFRDDWLRPPPQKSVQDRLGPHKRDCSPPSDGGVDGRGNRAGLYGSNDRFPRRRNLSISDPCHQRPHELARVWARKTGGSTSTTRGNNDQAGQGLVNMATPLQREPLPWDMSGAYQLLSPFTQLCSFHNTPRRAAVSKCKPC
jgi:hypothetical protein